VAARPPELGDPDAFELQLRKLGGVVAVGFSGSPDERIVHVTIADPDAADRVRGEADELARLYLGRPVWLIVTSTDAAQQPAAARRTHGRSAALDLDESGVEPSDILPTETADTALHRVELTGVRRHDGRTIEVVLAYGGHRSGALAEANPAAVASATVQALHDLGLRAPFEVSSAIRLGVGVTGAVVVVLSGAEGERLGMARSPTPEEAAAKATLQALNRYLDDPRRQLF